MNRSQESEERFEALFDADQGGCPAVVHGKGPQAVVIRVSPHLGETIFRSADFERAREVWVEGNRAVQEANEGGYTVWISNGEILRYSGLLGDYLAARAIRERAWRGSSAR